jgi:hypothetical protein
MSRKGRELKLIGRTVRLLAVIGAVALLAATVGTVGASANDGNSDAAHACQDGGYEDLFREDGTPFKNTGECVSYAAHGGRFREQSTATLTNVIFTACNELTLGYELDGVLHDLQTKPAGCTVLLGEDQTITYFSDQTLRLFLYDVTCDYLFFEDGLHATIVGVNPREVTISDGGGFCESPPDQLRPGANVALTETFS